MSTSAYSMTIKNEYLNKVKVIKGATTYEVNEKAQAQLNIWKQQEEKQRERDAAQKKCEELKQKAEELNNSAVNRIKSYKEILALALEGVYSIDWDKMKKTLKYDLFSYPKFEFTDILPDCKSIDYFNEQCKVPQKSFLENILKSKMTFRIQKEQEAKAAYEKERAEYFEKCKEFENRKQEAKQKYDCDRAAALKDYEQKKVVAQKEINDYNKDIDRLKSDFERGEPAAISQIMCERLNRSKYPSEFVLNYDIKYKSEEKIAVISLHIPSSNDFSRIKEYKYVNSTKSIKEIEFKPKEFDAIYDSMIKQTALRSLYKVFKLDYPQNIESAVFNGWVSGIDKATGQSFNVCILSVQMSRFDFANINFEKIDPDACIRNLKGLYAGNLAELAPVKPIMEIDTTDSRFITSKEIIDTLESGDNLATMDWEDFEHLVRELFSKYFSADGQEVQVTQSSRDGGVDAIAFDSDPIRGGKFVIQAKRYNKVVPVSAVRDLYGTMINEGAVKGILVTTSYFGNDSREFVKDKPISLIDGNNLIHMFSEFGYDVHIVLQK